MKLEHQVENYELCRGLKELEVKQEGIFYWVQPADGAVIGPLPKIVPLAISRHLPSANWAR
jgi:hypothetical protein